MGQALTSSSSRRVGDKIALGVRRYADTNDSPLWRLVVSKGCHGDVLIEEDATATVLREIRAWADHALELITTDGNRTTPANGEAHGR